MTAHRSSRTHGPTSRSVSRELCSLGNLPVATGNSSGSSYRIPPRRAPDSRTTDATDNSLPAFQYYGSLIVELYNHERIHQGRWCFGKMQMQTFNDSLMLAKEKLLSGALQQSA